MDPVHPSPTLEFLHIASKRIAAAGPLHEVLDEIVGFVSDFVSCDSCFLYVLEGNQLILRASKNPHPDVVDRLRVQLGEGITGWVAKHREPVVIERNASSDPRFRAFMELPEDTYQSFLSIPVISRGRVVSVLNLQHKEPYVFTPREIKAIATIAHLAGSAIELARLEGEVSDLADKLEVRKLVERAKGIVQSQFGVSEEEAYSILKKQARSRRKTMREIAEAILMTEELKRAQQKDSDDAA
jgi:uroporphyrinogen-III synthase